MAKLIRALLDARGWTQPELAHQLDSTQPTISRWLAGAEPRGDKRDAIRALAIASGLIEETPPQQRRTVPLMGFIGAGAVIDPEFEQVPPDGFDQVELPFALDDDVIALKVAGDSMKPIYNDGDVIIVRAQMRRPIESLTGSEAAVRTADGKRYLKNMIPGTKRGTYTLLSMNADPIIDARIVWASEIVAIVPAAQTRLIGRKATAAGTRRVTGKSRGRGQVGRGRH